MPDYICSLCGTIWLAKQDANLTCAKLACNNNKLDKYVPTSVKQVVVRSSLKVAQAQLAQKLVQKANYLGKMRSRLPVAYFDKKPSDDAETQAVLDKVEARELQREAEDFEFVPTAARWEFSQRLTSADMDARKRPAKPNPIIKQIAQQVAAPIDGERQKDCAIIVGPVVGTKRITAWALTNQIGAPMGTRWLPANKNTAEWCHLVGVSLGGRTICDNLVAASYCANTYMGVIEKAIQGRTDFLVDVQIESGQPTLMSPALNYSHIADWIIYVIRPNQNKSLILAVYEIDARIIGFSQADADRLEKDLAGKLPKQK